MFVSVYFFVPETKGRTLEAMDEIFGSAYADRDGAVDVELGQFRNELQRKAGGDDSHDVGEAIVGEVAQSSKVD